MEMKYYGIGGADENIKYYVRVDGLIWEVYVNFECSNHPCSCCIPEKMKREMRADGTVFYEGEWNRKEVTGDINHPDEDCPTGEKLVEIKQFCIEEEKKL